MPRSRISRIAAGLILLAACDKPAPPQTTPDSSSAKVGPQSPAVGGKMNEVAKNLGKNGIKPDELAKQPPLNGIFAEGVADKAHAPNAPPKLELLQEGKEPRVMLHAGPLEAQTIALVIDLGQGQGRIAIVEVAPPELSGKLVETLAKADDDDAKPSGSASASASAKPPKKGAGSASASAAESAATPPPPVAVAPPAANGDRQLVATVLGQRGLADEMNATITFTLTKAGVTNVTRKFKKDLPDANRAKAREFELDMIQEMLFANYTGVPDKPVGEGAQWTVEDRVRSLGTDVVRYRLFQVAKVDGDQAEVHMMIRQYAASETSELASQVVSEPDPILRAYDFVTEEGRILVGPRGYFPIGGAFSFRLQSIIVPKKVKDDPSVQGKQVGIEGTVKIGQPQLKRPGDKDDGEPKPTDKDKGTDKVKEKKKDKGGSPPPSAPPKTAPSN